MKKVLAIVLAFAMVLSFAACAKKEETTVDLNAKSEGVLTYEQYAAAELNSQVTIEGYIQSVAYSEAYGNASLFLADLDGAYYVYRMNVTAEEAAKLTEGTKLKVVGYKSEWSGEVEITDVSEFTVEENTYVAEAADITSILGDEAALAEKINQKVTVKGMIVEPSLNANGETDSVLYNWDGSGAAGNNNDLYINVSLNGTIYSFTVESDEVAEGTEAYDTAASLNVGDTVDFTGFLYWYNGPQLHINGVTVTKAAEYVVKSSEAMNYALYEAAELNTEVTVEGYVQMAAYNSAYGNVSMFIQDEDGAYYVYRATCDDALAAKLTEGTLVQVKGYKSEWAGEVEISDATIEVMDATADIRTVNVTELLPYTELLANHMNEKVAITGLTIVNSTAADGTEAPFLYNWDGSGAAGSNNDLYFNAQVGNYTYSFTVESDEVAEGTDAYTAVTQLQAGDTINIEGFLYWYNGPQIHVTAVK